MANLLDVLHADLAAESSTLLAVLDLLDESGWSAATGCAPWTVKDQVAHLAWNDDATVRALTAPAMFISERPTTPEGIQQMVDRVIVDHTTMSGYDLLSWFRNARQRLLDTVVGLDPKLRMPWYGPDMSIASKLTARLMETWAHGYDVVEALGLSHPRTDRVRHVVFLGLQAIPNTFIANGRTVPDRPVRLELVAPGGEIWLIGHPEATNVVHGDAYELARVVTQRCHRDDTRLEADGEVADEWLSIAQAFAGPPGPGRQPTGIRPKVHSGPLTEEA